MFVESFSSKSKLSFFYGERSGSFSGESVTGCHCYVIVGHPEILQIDQIALLIKPLDLLQGVTNTPIKMRGFRKNYIFQNFIGVIATPWRSVGLMSSLMDLSNSGMP